jgi:exodeoxyribonuclease VII small subunit
MRTQANYDPASLFRRRRSGRPHSFTGIIADDAALILPLKKHGPPLFLPIRLFINLSASVPCDIFLGMATKKRDDTGEGSMPPSPTFESALAELETLVRDLERDDLSLDHALESFERGVKLLRVCDTHLNHARGKITELLKGEDGAFIEKLLGTSLESFLNEEKKHD